MPKPLSDPNGEIDDIDLELELLLALTRARIMASQDEKEVLKKEREQLLKKITDKTREEPEASSGE